MDISTLPLLGPLLHLGAELLVALAAALAPVAGPLAAALAVVVLTVAVRLALVPLSVLQVRAERDRRRLAPQLAALRQRHQHDAERLRRAVQELYTAEQVAPLAGCLPMVAQAPVLSVVSALFTHASIGGTTNALLTATLAGVPLGLSLVGVVTSPLWVHAWVVLVVLAVLALVVELTRRSNRRWNAPAEAFPDSSSASTAAVMTRVAPFVTVIFAASVPFAAALYVVTSASWSLLERAVLRRALA